MFSFAMTSGLASDSDKFKIIITLVFKIDKYARFSFAMTSGLASDFDKFKIIITLVFKKKSS